MEQGYNITKWSGLDNYECLFCPLKTVDLSLMDEHLWRDHGFVPGKPVEEFGVGEEVREVAAQRNRVEELVEAHLKDKLISMAEDAGIDVDENETKAEIATRLVEAEEREGE